MTDAQSARRDDEAGVRYDRRALSYATSFDSPARQAFVRGVEWLTGKPRILRMVRAYERRGPVKGQGFWSATLDVQGITVGTAAAQIARIPRDGPVVLVANHPHGMVDGMVLAELIGRRRRDYRILTRSLLTGIDPEATRFMIPVPFPNQQDAQRQMIRMRQAAMAHLSTDGLLALFPSGTVAASESLFGPAVEAEWNVFTAKLIRTARATVVPCCFPGANSRAYMIANRISPLLRQSLLLHEVARTAGQTISPVIGEPIPYAAIEQRMESPRATMAWLREVTLALGQRVGTGVPSR